MNSIELAHLENEVRAADENAYRCGEEARDAEVRAANAQKYADNLMTEYMAAYEDVNGEPWQAPEPKYREIPGLE